jgi:predicted TIM-barrel fold metal-dependent hydrolase
MFPLSRRDTLRLGGGALAASALPGCGTPRPEYPNLPQTGLLIDAHCHLFNGRDLPITTFLTRLALPSHQEKCDLNRQDVRSLTIEDPSLAEALLKLMVDWLLGAAPTARQERDHLERDHTTTAASDGARVRRRTVRNLAAFLDETPPDIQIARALPEVRLRDALLQEASAGLGTNSLRTKGLRTLPPREAAKALPNSNGTFGALIRWAELFFRSRQSLAQELAVASNGWGRKPLMLVPMMVDYAHWLGETTSKGSSFHDQIAVYGALSRRSPVPVHGMVPFDPLRSVFWTRGRHNRFPDTPEFDPLHLAEEALTDHGFLGLKLYPPMGFRATGNKGSGQQYPEKALKALQISAKDLGAELDCAMLRAFDFCLRHDAPMLAHASNSVAAGEGYGRRAEPRFWIDALKTRPTLRLALAHGGGFCWQQSAPDQDTPVNRSSWEWTIGQYVRDNPDSHLYMDVSYFSEVFPAEGRLDYVAKQLQDWIKECDPDARHILYGTDWIMLEQVPDFARYGVEVLSFLKDRCKLTDAQIDRVMWQNAMRFLGLDSGKTRDRMLTFYGSRRPDWTKLSLT